MITWDEAPGEKFHVDEYLVEVSASGETWKYLPLFNCKSEIEERDSLKLYNTIC